MLGVGQIHGVAQVGVEEEGPRELHSSEAKQVRWLAWIGELLGGEIMVA